jgi:hypothetical protein
MYAGHIEVYDDKLKLVGVDCMMSLDMPTVRKTVLKAA